MEHPSDKEADLPRATIHNIIKDLLGPNIRVSQEAVDLIRDICVNFVVFISAESNKVCLEDDKKTISDVHISKVLKQNHMKKYLAEILKISEE